MQELEKVVMDDDKIECMKIAEEKRDLSYVIKGNKLKRDTTKESIGVLEKEVLHLEKETKIKIRNEYVNVK